MQNQVKEMLMNNTLCVLCTSSNGSPYCSLMTYVLSDDLKTVYMVTVRESKKYRNLLTNPIVSLLVDTRQRLDFPSDTQVASVTFEGVLKHLEPTEQEKVRIQLADRHVELNDILKNPDCVIFGIELKSFLLLTGPVDAIQGNL